ncbi:hypothetical protein COV16_02190 [Candidatus Woesearchaeota archaeon CG10_big_fil_rev_8_21_14_0_10_34_8]|nr:MAG: hypothetical protein COV16_02190 [Candidatus Woesearchaeota archaeon CG10_big_fil_rev_8_21_14_0_10_34_8]
MALTDLVGEGMAKKKKDPKLEAVSKLSANDVLEYAQSIHREREGFEEHYIDDLKERAEHVVNLLDWYRENRGKLEAEVTDNLREIERHLHEHFGDFHKRVNDKYKANDKDPLEDEDVEDLLKELTVEVYKKCGYGVKGEGKTALDKQHTYMQLQNQVAALKKNGVDTDQLMARVQEGLRRGNGEEATSGLMEILKRYEGLQYQASLQNHLINEDSAEFKHAYGKNLAPRLEEMYDVKVTPELVIENMGKYAQAHMLDNYKQVLDLAKRHKKKEPKKKPSYQAANNNKHYSNAA